MDNAAPFVTSKMTMPQSEPSDADNIRLSLDGDQEAFCRLYDRYARLVRTVVVGVSGDLGAAEDLTQETFLRAYRRLATLRDVDSFCSWIQGIARLVARERRRTLLRDRREFEADSNRKPQVPIYEPGNVVEDDEFLRHAISAVADLPERERLAVHAYYFHEQSGEEAAHGIGMSRSGFYAALERGMTRLRQKLGVTMRSPLTGENDEAKRT